MGGSSAETSDLSIDSRNNERLKRKTGKYAGFDAKTVQERLKTVGNHKARVQNLQNFRLRRITWTLPSHRPPHPPSPYTGVPSPISVFAEREIREPDLSAAGECF